MIVDVCVRVFMGVFRPVVHMLVGMHVGVLMTMHVLMFSFHGRPPVF